MLLKSWLFCYTPTSSIVEERHFILKLTQQKFLVNPALTKLSKNHEIQCNINLIDCKHLLHKYVAYCIFLVC